MNPVAKRVGLEYLESGDARQFQDRGGDTQHAADGARSVGDDSLRRPRPRNPKASHRGRPIGPVVLSSCGARDRRRGAAQGGRRGAAGRCRRARQRMGGRRGREKSRGKSSWGGSGPSARTRGRHWRRWAARPDGLCRIPNLYSAARDVVSRPCARSADGFQTRSGGASYAGCWIWTSENNPSRTLGE
jgi:hypothetical protein